jgi:hypothetical protein
VTSVPNGWLRIRGIYSGSVVDLTYIIYINPFNRRKKKKKKKGNNNI